MSAPSARRPPGVRRVMLVAGAATVGVTSLLMLSPLGARAAMPGPLSGNHAPLREECSACHAESLDAIQGLGHGLAGTSMDLEQSSRCLACHDDLGARPLHAHGWNEALLAARRSGSGPGLRGVPAGPGGEIGCATCHVEHNGSEHDLTSLDDARCQVCHTVRFSTFEDGHSAFEAYPHRRRSRIVFDHLAHVDDYFERDPDLAPESCSSCHPLDPAGRRMAVADYGAACAGCHDGEIRGASQVDGAGVVFFALPALDTLALEESGVGIGDWPADSSLVETPLTPFMKLMLRTDAQAARDLEALDGLDLLDLSEASREQLEVVAGLAWSIKELFGEIRDGGHAALAGRLRAALGSELDPHRAEDLLRLVPRELVADAVRSWFPRLDAELSERSDGRAPPTSVAFAVVEAGADRARESWVELGGWHLQELDFSLRYRPAGHGDAFLSSWLETSAAVPGGELFRALSRPGAIGACTRCHSTDSVQGELGVNWSAGPRPQDVDPLTFFPHDAHLVADSDNVCQDCHELANQPGAYLETFLLEDPERFTPGFHPMDKEACSRCHEARGASAACTTCHRYHDRAGPGTVTDRP